MKSIFASKLYRASKRKDRIQAALLSPSNMGLVQQLADSLDEPYKTAENLGVPVDKPEATETADFIVDEEINPETDLMTVDDLDIGKSSKSQSSSKPHRSAPSSHMPSGPKPSLDDIDRPESDSKPDGDAPNTPPPESSTPSDETEASTRVTSCTEVDLAVIKDSLNSRADTCSVSRVAEKDGEVWIYYKDDVNLNNIMTDVIEYLMNAGFSSLEFNRLARSDNAIVFVKTNAVGQIPVAAAINVGPVPSTVEVKKDPKEDTQHVTPSMTALKKAEQWIRAYKANDTEQSQDKITDIQLEEDCISITFQTHPKLIITKEDAESGEYKGKVETVVEGEAVSTDVPDGSFQEILDRQ